jgi:hypothetical protein
MSTECPFCGGFADAEFVDVGVGGQGVQVTAYECGDCLARQFNPYHDNSRATEEEARVGWWRGPPDPNPYATEPENIAAIKAGLLSQAAAAPRGRWRGR